jgi:hypothetical protein
VSNPRSAGFVKGFELPIHPRRAFWFVAGAAVITGIAWAVAGGRSLSLRNDYASLSRPLTGDESRSLSGWSLASDISMGLTAALGIGAVFTW